MIDYATFSNSVSRYLSASAISIAFSVFIGVFVFCFEFSGLFNISSTAVVFNSQENSFIVEYHIHLILTSCLNKLFRLSILVKLLIVSFGAFNHHSTILLFPSLVMIESFSFLYNSSSLFQNNLAIHFFINGVYISCSSSVHVHISSFLNSIHSFLKIILITCFI
jgi:hypothetical protein